MTYTLLSTLPGGPPGFCYVPAPDKRALRRGIFALYTDNVDALKERLGDAFSMLAGLIITPGAEFMLRPLSAQLWLATWNPTQTLGAQVLAHAGLDLVRAIREEQKRFQVLHIEAERERSHYRRLADYFEVTQAKLRSELQERDKWTNAALTELVKFTASTLQSADSSAYPALITSFFAAERFGYAGVAFLSADGSGALAACAAYGMPIEVPWPLHSPNPDKDIEVADGTAFISLVCEDARHIVAVAKSRLTPHFTDYELSFFRLFASLISATFKSRLAERDLQAAKAQAEAASRAKSEFLANISHELRTPLHGVLGVLRLLDTTRLDEDQRDLIRAARNSGQSLLAIIDDLLDLSRIESHRLAIVPRDISLRELIGAVADTFAMQSAERGVPLVIERMEPTKAMDSPEAGAGVGATESTDMVRVDPDRVRQILCNLVGNAFKFTEAGEVRLRYGQRPGPGDTLELCFAVKDTGIGIPADKLESVFEAFTQVDGSYRRRYSGPGLGLSIVRRLVDLMGGSVGIESKAGLGTEVRVSLPAGIGHAARPLPAQALPEGQDTPLRILVVEDNRINRLVARRLLERHGYEVLLAETGKEALEILTRDSVDCVLMDIQMPEMDGVEATRRIRETIPHGRELPIIALTAHAMKGDRDHFLSQGLSDYLSKPLDVAALSEVLARIVPQGASPS